MADVELHVIAVAKVGAVARIELDLKKVVEAAVGIVLRFSSTPVTTKLNHKRPRLYIFDPQGGCVDMS